METKAAAKKQIKPSFGDLIEALRRICQFEKAAGLYGVLIRDAVGSWEDAQINLDELRARSTNPVIRQLALQAMKAR